MVVTAKLVNLRTLIEYFRLAVTGSIPLPLIQAQRSKAFAKKSSLHKKLTDLTA